MTRYFRFEEIDGDVIVRVPAEMAAELGFVAGEEGRMTRDDAGLTVARIDENVQRQLRIGRRIMKENAGVLAALAK